jgi:hypothetical protein
MNALIFPSVLVGLGIVLKEPYKHKFSRGLKNPDTLPTFLLLLNGTGANSEQNTDKIHGIFSRHLPPANAR